MPNTTTLTNLSPEIYKAADIVARELVGFIPASTVNTADQNGVNSAAYGDPIKSLATGEVSVSTSFTPSMTVSAATDTTDTALEFSLNKIAKADFPLTGETLRRLNNTTGGGQYRVDKFAQLMRAVVNQIEAEAGEQIVKGAHRAIGTAGTAPFASTINIMNEAHKVLQDAGAPKDGNWSMVFDTSAGMNLRNKDLLRKVNESGDSSMLRQGALGQLSNFNLYESGGTYSHTKGTATGYDLTAGFSIGDKTLTVDGSDTGTILAGDVTQFATDGYNYIVASASASGAASGNIVLNDTGLVAALSSADEGVTGASYTGNAFFHRSAVEIAIRAADMGGSDIATDVLMVTDPISGIPFEFRIYPGEGMGKIQVVCYYGVKVWKSAFTHVLMG